MSATDEKIQELFKKVEQKKQEIKKIERPSWVTNCSFSYGADGSGARLNLHVISDPYTLVEVLAFLMQKEEYFQKAQVELLGAKAEKFKWMGYTIDEWKQDLSLRYNIINVSKKKAQLAELEDRLSGLVSPEEKRRLEVAAIAEMLETGE